MTLSGFVLFVWGILSELALLYESAHMQPAQAGQGELTLVARALTPARQAALWLGLPAGLLVAIFELFKTGDRLVYIDTPLVSAILMILGVTIFFAALGSNLFLPPVTEQSILVVQGLVITNTLWGGQPVDWLPLFLLSGVPAAICLALVISRRTIPAWIKALLYLWYLLSLMIIPFQNGQAGFFRQLHLTWAESASFGMLLIFLIIHGLFAVRFFLIVSSMLRPSNRIWVDQLMPRLFSDEQAPRLRFGLAVLLIAGLLLLNQWLGLVERPLAVSLAMLLGVQILSRRGQSGLPGETL